ncbi:uncharacterized protein LOC134267284 [Saccostrea cucullata]|uniref:uncharacterized protein LOC134267284 n=1 Tax=Saccostrea cuccullata TaxID=36930 RepID=UPI002ED52989
MGRTKKRKEIWTPSKSPAQRLAAKVSRKYKSPHKTVRKALYQVNQNKLSIRRAALENNLSFSFLQRRTSGKVDVDSKRGPKPVFKKAEEEAFANYLSEMAQRGMGLRPTEFLDFVENIMKKDKRENPFKDDRPSWDWYYGFLRRNSHIIQKRTETPLEISRAKVTVKEIDEWFDKYKIFMSDNHLLDKPERVYNADETGFTMGSKSGQVIGPAKKVNAAPVPHVSGGRSKERVTVMYCANAEGTIIPPFFVFSKPKPASYDLLAGSHRQAHAEFTEKGWMDAETFRKFIKHLHNHAVKERPIVLLIDSVGSHVDMESFSMAKDLGIEIYRLVRNATHLMQPLDVGVYGPLKKSWYKHLRAHTKQHPEDMVRKQTFARHLQVAFLDFYKPLTVQKSFASSGVFPIDRSKISDSRLKPALTYEEKLLVETSSSSIGIPPIPYEAQSTSSSIPSTSSTEPAILNAEVNSGLDILAQAVCALGSDDSVENTGLPVHASIPDEISPHIKDAVKIPTVKLKKTNRKRLADELPDNLTSTDSIRKMGLKSLEKTKKFALRERKAKEKFLKSKEKAKNIHTLPSKRKVNKPSKGSSKSNKRVLKSSSTANPILSSASTSSLASDVCFVCHADESVPGLWIQCEKCQRWEHIACIPDDHQWNRDAISQESVIFICQICTNSQGQLSEQPKREILLRHCVIKGYHDFKIKPLQSNQVPLRVDREYTNIHDPDACLVWIPDNVPADLKETVTDEKRGLKLKDIEGLPCGHVPRGLASAFRYVMDAGGEISAIVTGFPTPSFPPWPPMLEKGGGVVIPCTYRVCPTNFHIALTIIQEHLEDMPEKEVIELIEVPTS